MEKGLVDLEKLRKNVLKADFHGKSAFCFVDGNELIKVYARKQDGDFITLNTGNIDDFSIFNAKTIVFPHKYIYEDGSKAGEIMSFISDKTIEKSFNGDTNISLLIKNYELVFHDFIKFPDFNMVDLCYVNILYSNENGFHIIDTTEWTKEENSFKKNIFNFNSSLGEVFIRFMDIPIIYSKYYNSLDDNFLKNIGKYGKAGNDFKDKLMRIKNYDFQFLSLLFSYIEMYYIYCNNDVYNFKELEDFTKVLKKG